MDGLIGSTHARMIWSALRSKIATAVTLGGERPRRPDDRLGRLWLNLGEYRSLEEELDRINAVTLDDLREVYKAFPIRPTMVGRFAAGGVIPRDEQYSPDRRTQMMNE